MSENFGSMGFMLQAIIYICSMAASFLTPALIKKFGLRRMLCIGAVLFCIVIVA